jgi:flagellar hook-associated protein 2
MNGSMTLDLKTAGGSSLQMQQYAVTSRSTAAWDSTADASGTRSTYTLSVGGTKYSFTPADNSATSVAGAINSLYGSLVTASVVDLHTGGNPDYRISLRSANGSSTEINLEKTTGTSFQAEQTQGALAAYEINGSGVTNTSATRDITISTGVTATLVGVTSGSAVDITVTRSTSALNTALSGFADAYNSAADELALHRGQTAGSLRGDSVVSQLSRVLSSIATYSSDGSINGLSSLGLELGTDGHFSYSAFTLMATDISSPAGVTAFLGSASDGGFLKTATDALKGVEDATTGILKAAKTDVQSQITKLTSTITEKQTAVDKLQQRLLSQMAAADALIASLEQKYSYLTSMFEAQRASQSQ